MGILDRCVKALEIGIPLDVVRNAHPDVRIQDMGTEYHIVLKNKTHYIDHDRVVFKHQASRLRQAELDRILEEA